MMGQVREHRAERTCPRGGAALLAGLGLALLWAFPHAGRTRNANEVPRLLQAEALVERGTWRIDGLGRDPGPDVSRGAEPGSLYPNKPPATSAVAAAGYAVARELARGTGDPPTRRAVTWWARLFGAVLPTLGLCAVLWRSLAPRFGARATALAIVLYALGTPAFAYGHVLYGHALAALLLWSGLLALLRAGEARRPGLAWLAGALAGGALLVEYTAAFAGLALVGLALALAREGAWKVAGAAAIGAAGPVAALMAYHAAAFGGPFKTGYHASATAAFAEKHGEGLLGLVAPNWPAIEAHLLSIRSGLSGWAPLWPVALAGLVWLARGTGGNEHVRRARVELAAFAGVLLACVSLNFEGGWRVGPRYLMVAMPALVLGWAAVASRALAGPPRGWAGVLGLFVAAGLAGWSLTVNGLAGDLWPHLDLGAVNQPVPEVLWPLWRAGREPSTLLGIGVTWPIAAGLAAAAGLAMPRAIGRRGQAAVALGVALGVALVAATPRIFAPHPRGPANLRYIESVWEPPRAG